MTRNVGIYKSGTSSTIINNINNLHPVDPDPDPVAVLLSSDGNIGRYLEIHTGTFSKDFFSQRAVN